MIPIETDAKDDGFDYSTPTEALSPIVIAFIAVVTVLVSIFVVTIVTMRKRLKMKSRNMQSVTYNKTEKPEEDYDFLNESMV